MARVTEFFHHLIQDILWRSFLSHFQWPDWITIFLVLGGVVYGVRRGFLRALAEFLETVLLVFLVFRMYVEFGRFLGSMGLSHKVAPGAGFLIASAAFFGTIAFVDRFLARFVAADMKGFLRPAGGAAFGAATALLLWSLLVNGLVLLPMPPVRRAFEMGSSATGFRVRLAAPETYKEVGKLFRMKAKA